MLSLLLKTKRSFWVLLFLSIRFSFPSRCVKLCSKIQQNIQIFAATNTEAQINFMLQNHRLVSNTTMNSLQSPSAPQLARKRTQMNMNGKLWFLYMKAQFVWKLNLYKSGLTKHTNTWFSMPMTVSFLRDPGRTKSIQNQYSPFYCWTLVGSKGKEMLWWYQIPFLPNTGHLFFPKEITLICWLGSKANSQKSIYCKCRHIIAIIIKANIISALYKLFKTYYQSMK